MSTTSTRPGTERDVQRRGHGTRIRAGGAAAGARPAGDGFDTDLIEARSEYYALYIQDDWKLTPRLTLNLGLRWDMDSPRWEGIDNRQGLFDPALLNPVSGTPGAMFFSGRDGRSKYAHDFDKNNFGPRFGFAWRPFGDRTVVRGGFGVMSSGAYDNSVAFVGFAGFSDSREFISPNNGLTAAFLLRDGIPPGVREPLGPGLERCAPVSGRAWRPTSSPRTTATRTQ